MLQTQIVSTSVAAELFSSIGLEVTVFAISIALALAFRGVTFGQNWNDHKQSMNAAHLRPSRADRGRSVSPSGKKETKHLPSRAQAKVPAKREEIKHLSSPTQATVPAKRDHLTQKIDSMVNCANRRQCAEALVIYQAMRANDEHKAIKDHTSTSTRHGKKGPADVFAALVLCAGNVGRPDLIEVLFDDMMAAGIDRSLTFYETTMKMLASKKCYKEALGVCTRLEADGLEPSPVTLSCLISFAVELGKLDRAVNLFDRLSACSMPSIRAYMTILRVHSRRQEWRKSLLLIRDMQIRQAPLDSLVLNIVLSTGVAAGQVDAAKSLLKEFANIGLADVVSYNTVMKGVAQKKSVGQALNLLEEMRKAGVAPNAITFNTLIDVAARTLRVEDAWGVLAQMLDAGLAPDTFTCASLMKGVQNGATSEQLSRILDLLKSTTLDSTSQTCQDLFRSVIEAASQVNDPALARRAVSQMQAQKLMLQPHEYHGLLQVLMREC